MARLKEYKRVDTGRVSRDAYKNLNQAFRSWENAYKRFKKNGSALAFYECRRAGMWYQKYGGTRNIVIPKRLVLEASKKSKRTYKSKKTGKLVTVDPIEEKKKKRKKRK